jgi:uncharacterized protein YndB with AHSA1/START domain
MSASATFKFSREFNAPRERVFNAFSNAEALNAWWGPIETETSVIKLDFRAGGIFHYRMKSQEKITYGRFLFNKIQPFELLEFTNAFADENAKVVRPPFDIILPLEIFYRLRFTEHKGKTLIQMTGEPVNASPDEVEGFLSINLGMEQGFGATFNKLFFYLEKQNP